jgi:hypothetical protein
MIIEDIRLFRSIIIFILISLTIHTTLHTYLNCRKRLVIFEVITFKNLQKVSNNFSIVFCQQDNKNLKYFKAYRHSFIKKKNLTAYKRAFIFFSFSFFLISN